MSKMKLYNVSMSVIEHILDHVVGLNDGFVMFTVWLGKLVLFAKIWFPELWNGMHFYLAVLRVK